jgi:transcriptional repressor NrdR
LRRFTTFETIELTLQVHKRDGRYEDFQQEKLIKGIEAACRHTRVSHDQVIAVAATITGEFFQGHYREISTRQVGEMVMSHLKNLDPIAYIRFACEYKRFKQIDELVQVIESIQAKEICDEPVKTKL